jgi:hypothetical protein
MKSESDIAQVDRHSITWPSAYGLAGASSAEIGNVSGSDSLAAKPLNRREVLWAHRAASRREFQCVAIERVSPQASMSERRHATARGPSLTGRGKVSSAISRYNVERLKPVTRMTAWILRNITATLASVGLCSPEPIVVGALDV